MMSGGVDSSVASACLKEQGYNLVGVFMKCWSLEQLESLGVSKDLYGCFWEDDVMDAELVTKKLGIPFEVWNFEGEYRQKVVEYMLHEYKIGRTPNPDVMCNSMIKFGIFYEKAMARGADFVATGHYARIAEKYENYGPVIARGKDENKDQSYFLWGIKKEQLAHILFPIGEFETKQEVRKKAEELDLITAKKPDSQGLCFVGKTPLRELLMQTLGKKEGQIMDVSGKKLGVHEGAYLYTIGQREKLGLSGGPWFVIKIDVEQNQVIVAHSSNQTEMYKKSCEVINLNWQVDEQVLYKLNYAFQSQVRYRQQPVDCTFQLKQDSNLVTFSEDVRAVAQGQSIVFYDGDVMLGGGIINL